MNSAGFHKIRIPGLPANAARKKRINYHLPEQTLMFRLGA